MSKKKKKVVFKKGEGDIRPLDLVNMEKVVHLNTQFLEKVFDQFSRELGRTLSRYFRKNVATSLISQDVLKVGDFFNSVEGLTCLSIFKVNNEIDRGFLNFEKNLTHELLTLGYGGRESHSIKTEGKEFTQLELKFMEGLIRKVLSEFGHSFSSVCPMEFKHEKFETNPRFFAPSTNVVIILTFEVNFAATTGVFNMALPYNKIEKLRRKI